MGRPMGAYTRSISASENPAASSFSRVAATFFRLPIQPIYRAGVGRTWASMAQSAR